MKFVIVADRTLKGRHCGLCCGAIKGSYVRDLETRLPYCGPDCYREHLDMSARPLESHGRRVS
jgi:hypothetical protein